MDGPCTNRAGFRKLAREFCEGECGISVLDSLRDQIDYLTSEKIEELIERGWLLEDDEVTIFEVQHDERDKDGLGKVSFHNPRAGTIAEVLELIQNVEGA